VIAYSTIPVSESKYIQSESERLLLDHYRDPSVGTRNRIVILNAGLVRAIAHRISKVCSEKYEDLEQIGYMGLINAIDRFVPVYGNKFSTYAVPYIEGAIKHYLRDTYRTIKLPRRLEQLYKDGEKARKSLREKLGRDASDSEVASYLQVTLSEWREALKIKNAKTILSLDVKVAQIEGFVSLGDNLVDEVEKITVKSNEEYEFVRDLVSSLDLKFRQVIECVYLRGLPRKHAAKIIGVSPMTVSRRLGVAIVQMQKLYNQAGISS
jgi:RNA polymerase sigma-B factor